MSMTFTHLKRKIRCEVLAEDGNTYSFRAFDLTDDPNPDPEEAEGEEVTDSEDLGALRSIFRHRIGKVRF